MSKHSKSTKIPVRYTKQFETEVQAREIGVKYIEGTYYKNYLGALAKLAGVGYAALYLFIYYLEHMDEFNMVHTGKHTLKRYNSYRANNGKEPVSLRHIQIQTKNLMDAKFLIKEQNGLYLVNPEYFDRGTEKQRVAKVRVMLEFQEGVRTNIDVENEYTSLKIDNNEENRD